ncbi:MAG TPA: sigma-54-dependent Fis family transcriptional regulator [Bacteroidetes bacterium]|nr:sigma-54-dependent Fis family transcriptional regulator [Bacteroidota bacterium]
MEINILIVDDEEDIGFALQHGLSKDGYHVTTILSGEEGVEYIKNNLIDLVLLDIRLPEKDGFQVLQEIKEIDPDILVVMMTAFPNIEPAIRAMKLGAYDYLTKPFQNLSEVRLIVNKALETQRLRREVIRFKRQLSLENIVSEIFGNSKKIVKTKEMIRIVSGVPRTSVLIQGESGTGKELVANAVHYGSKRAQNPLVKINCSAIPDNLLESELFGHERGAFTDAKIMKKGLFELAHTGSIFLDEISSLKLSLQPKLLRVLETQSFRRIGGINDINVDVRIIAATNQNLENCVKDGTFRTDLFYRLKVMVINLPLLRERDDDIILLAKMFIDQNNREFNKDIWGLTEEAERTLLHYPWPGNVRELKNVIERAVILCNEELIDVDHLPRELYLASRKAPVKIGQQLTSDMSLSDMEKRHILFVLEAHENNKSQTARVLGISRSTLREKLRQYGIDDETD